jgi:hypothetical protein
MDNLVHLIVQAGIAALVPVVVAGAVQLLRRLHIQLSEAQQAALDAAIRRAILEAEEWGAARLKAKLPATSYQKLERAVNAVAPAFDLTPEEAETHIRALLPSVGAGATANFSRTPGPGAASPQP